jgi:hypothetical protein
MIIDPIAAKLFISGYTQLLGEVHLLSNGKSPVELLDMLAAARDAVVADPSLIERAVSRLESADVAVPTEVVRAVQSLQLRRWIFLRDTTRYSIFMELEAQEAYAVLGLTQPVREIVGGTGCILQTGVVSFHGAYVCDGIVSSPIWLGANYRREYAALFTSLKKSGHFHMG